MACSTTPNENGAVKEPTLISRAILPAELYQSGQPSGSLVTPDNGVTVTLAVTGAGSLAIGQTIPS
ncbi:hypothetical protein [Cystobacter fuscus]|nr:hypothetical protein [Cystobacter fuscus]